MILFFPRQHLQNIYILHNNIADKTCCVSNDMPNMSGNPLFVQHMLFGDIALNCNEKVQSQALPSFNALELWYVDTPSLVC